MSLFCLCSLSHLTNFPCHLQIVLQAQQAVLAQLSCPQVCISTGDPNTTQSQPWSATGTSKHSCDIGAGMCSMSPGNRMMKKKNHHKALVLLHVPWHLPSRVESLASPFSPALPDPQLREDLFF